LNGKISADEALGVCRSVRWQCLRYVSIHEPFQPNINKMVVDFPPFSVASANTANTDLLHLVSSIFAQCGNDC
jgi:hypothetical protein